VLSPGAQFELRRDFEAAEWAQRNGTTRKELRNVGRDLRKGTLPADSTQRQLVVEFARAADAYAERSTREASAKRELFDVLWLPSPFWWLPNGQDGDLFSPLAERRFVRRALAAVADESPPTPMEPSG
jgi:hypothetical protein